MAEKKPIAFLSYVRSDDEHDDNRISKLIERLSGEVKMQTGEDFPIFQDRNDIGWGENWKERIEESLDEVTFLIPILTPSFFKRTQCREEVEKFIEREKELKRNDLILPLYYVECPLLHNEEELTSDELAQTVLDHNWADWRDLRFESMTSAQVGRPLSEMAVQIRDAIGRTQPIERGSETSAKAEDNDGNDNLGELSGSGLQSLEIEGGGTILAPIAKTEPPTIIVDQMHRGDFLTLTEAVEKANPGDRILIRPGFYQEGIFIDKPLEIIGDGNRDDIVIQAKDTFTVKFGTTMGRLSNLSLSNTGDGLYSCIDIAQGRLEVEDCDITSDGRTCIYIHDRADPRVRRNNIHDGKQFGIIFYGTGYGMIEYDNIYNNRG